MKAKRIPYLCRLHASTSLACILLTAILPLATVSAATTISFPDSMRVQYGSTSNQPVSVLARQEQSGRTDYWPGYIEFYPEEKRGMQSIFEFYLPVDFIDQDIRSLQLRTNYKGQAFRFQPWQWHILNTRTLQWVPLGDNRSVPVWQWTTLQFTAPGNAADYVDPIGRVQIRFATTTSADNSNIDSIALFASTESITASTASTNTQAPVITAVQPSQSASQPAVATNILVIPRIMGVPGSEPVIATLQPQALSADTQHQPTVPAAVQSPTSPIWSPSPGTSWQWQLQGVIDTSFDVDMYNIDLFDTPASTINQLKTRGITVICYFSAGSYEDWRSDANTFPAQIRGASNGWPGEQWLDIRAIDTLSPIMQARLDLAANKGCDGVEPDNIDGHTNATGFVLSAWDQRNYNIWLAEQAHARNLSIGLKNNLSQVVELEPYFDWALNESCLEYNECELLTPFIEAGKAVFGVAYTGDPGMFCSKTNALDFDWLKKNRDLGVEREACR
ncbi:MAG: endo alpha-1,4 polygalactosaminidase [Granulosicoccus sp.]